MCDVENKRQKRCDLHEMCKGEKKMTNVYCNKIMEWFPEETLNKIIDVESNEQGQDVLTFICPNCGNQHRSLRAGK